MKIIPNQFVAAVVLIFTCFGVPGCGRPSGQSVTVTDSKLVYYSGGPMGFGAPNPFAVRVQLALRPGNYDQVTVTFIGDGQRLETKEISFLTDRPDRIQVECSKRAFTHAENSREIEVRLLSKNATVEGPYFLAVPKPVLEGMKQ